MVTGVEWQNFTCRHAGLRPTVMATSTRELTEIGSRTCFIWFGHRLSSRSSLLLPGSGWGKKAWVKEEIGALKVKSRSNVQCCQRKTKTVSKAFIHSEVPVVSVQREYKNIFIHGYIPKEWLRCLFLPGPSCSVGPWVSKPELICRVVYEPGNSSGRSSSLRDCLLRLRSVYVGQCMFSRLVAS